MCKTEGVCSSSTGGLVVESMHCNPKERGSNPPYAVFFFTDFLHFSLQKILSYTAGPIVIKNYIRLPDQ